MPYRAYQHRIACLQGFETVGTEWSQTTHTLANLVKSEKYYLPQKFQIPFAHVPYVTATTIIDNCFFRSQLLAKGGQSNKIDDYLNAYTSTSCSRTKIPWNTSKPTKR